MKHLIKTLILILIPFISFSQSLGKSGGKTRIAPTTQIRKGTKPRQVLMTRTSDSSLVYTDLDTIIKDTDIKLLLSVVNDSIRIDSFDNKLGVIVGSPQFIDDAINKPDLLQGAANDLRVSGTTIVEGTDDPNNAKGSQLIYNTTSVMDGFYRQYLGTEGVVFNIDAIRNSSNRIVTIDYGDLLVNNIRVGRGSGNVIGNTVVGDGAFTSNTTGTGNLAIGLNTLKQSISRSNCIAIGNYCSENQDNADYTIGVGLECLLNNRGSHINTMGYTSLRNNITGESITSQGSLSLYNNITGSNITASGYAVMYSNVSSNENTATGELSLYNLTSGLGQNSSHGSRCLYSNVTGAYNTGQGYRNLYYSLGTGNTSSGYLGLYLNVLGDYNTSFGYAAGYNCLGSNNVFIGKLSGYFETGSNKLYISNSTTTTPLIGGDFSTNELKIGGVQQFTIQYPTSGAGVINGSMFYGTDGGLYFKGGSGTVTLVAAP